MAASPVSLHFTRTMPKAPLPSASSLSPLPPRKVRFLLLHGFLAHSGSLNSLVANLRRGLDRHNETCRSATAAAHDGAAAAPVDYEILSVDARNHGLSPHTPDHQLCDLVADLGHFLNTVTPSTEDAATRGPPAPPADTNRTPTTTVAIGHSMGSGTVGYYLMRQQAMRRRGLLENEGDIRAHSACSSVLDVGSVPLSPALLSAKIDAFVSMDMPPITGSEMSDQLHAELLGMLQEMEKVRLESIVDMRGANAEFVRCGMTDVRIRGLCSTNLLLERGRPAAGEREGGRGPTARWKCNLPVLRRSLENYSLFFPEGFPGHPEDFSFPLELPVLSILGGASPIGGRRRFQQDWPRFAANLEQHIVAEATHTVFFDKPEATASLIFRFLHRIGVL